MVPTAPAAVRARFGCSAAHRRWAAFSVAASGHSVSNRESSPAPSVCFHPLSPSDWMYPGTASTTFGRSPASGNRFSKHYLTRRSSDTAATRVGSRKASASTSPASNKLLNRHSAASVFPDPVSDSAMEVRGLGPPSPAGAPWPRTARHAVREIRRRTPGREAAGRLGCPRRRRACAGGLLWRVYARTRPGRRPRGHRRERSRPHRSTRSSPRG